MMDGESKEGVNDANAPTTLYVDVNAVRVVLQGYRATWYCDGVVLPTG